MRKAWRKVKLGGETGVAMPEQGEAKPSGRCFGGTGRPGFAGPVTRWTFPRGCSAGTLGTVRLAWLGAMHSFPVSSSTTPAPPNFRSFKFG